jgi:hypothetical protein
MGTKTSRFHPSKQQGGGTRDEEGGLSYDLLQG